MESFTKVIRVDSRFRVSGTSTDFRVQLPAAVSFPPGVVCYVSALSVPHSWWNVEAGVSDKLFVVETKGAPETRRCRVLTVPPGNYTSLTLPGVVATALNTGSSLSGMAYAVDYLSARGCLRIQLAAAGAVDATARFRLPSEDELSSPSWKQSNWTGTADPYYIGDLDTMGDLLRLPAVSAPTTLLETGLIDISPIHVLYLHSSLASADTIGPRGDQDIIQRVPVENSYGFVIHYQSTGSDEEFFPLGGLSFQDMSFRLCTVHGRPVDLHGGQLSLELTFSLR
jgi:hypothetical protein